MDRDLPKKVQKLWKKRLLMGVSAFVLLEIALLQWQIISREKLRPVDDYDSIQIRVVADAPQLIRAKDAVKSVYPQHIVEVGNAWKRSYTRIQDLSRSIATQKNRLVLVEKTIPETQDESYQLEKKEIQIKNRLTELRDMHIQSLRVLEDQLKEVLHEGLLLQTLETVRNNSGQYTSIALLLELEALEQQLNSDLKRLRVLQRAWFLLYVSTFLMLVLVILLSQRRLKNLAFMVHSHAFLPEFCVAELAVIEERLEKQSISPIEKRLFLSIYYVRIFLAHCVVQFENTFLLSSNESVDD